MYLRKISVPSHLRFASSFKELSDNIDEVLCQNSYKRFLIVSGRGSVRRVAKKLFDSLSKRRKGELLVLEANSMATVKDLADFAKKYKPELIIGTGGGKILDVAKLGASKSKIPFFSVPTQVSHDGISSPVAIIKDGNKTLSLGAAIPKGVFVPLYLVKKASARSTSSGVGDLLSNITAVRDWQLAAEKGMEEYDDYAAIVAHTAANSIYTSYNNYASSKIDFTEDFIIRLVEGLILSGVAMEISGNSRPCSGSEHKISHAIDALFNSPALHGEQVALGILISLYLQGGDYEKMRKFFSLVGLPVHPKEIGLTKTQLVEAVCYAPQTRPGRYTILEKKNIKKRQAVEIVNNLWD
ncbi:MAG: iron-containing alcohol dehydrogenase [Candidatus Schekmanbacteria bacterium]|nr:MAG: iron-containing alcohol dehydrogenase [Candidatus Schekmanbacteria bacterium]